MYTGSLLIFLKTSEEDYSLNSRYIYIENVPEKFITVRRRLLGLVDTNFSLQAKQLSSDSGQWWQKLLVGSHPEPVKINVAVSQFNWSKDEAPDAVLRCLCAVRSWQLIVAFLFFNSASAKEKKLATVCVNKLNVFEVSYFTAVWSSLYLEVFNDYYHPCLFLSSE